MSKIDRVIPLLVYSDIQAAHDFLVKAFSFDPGGVQRDASGHAVHGEVRAGATSIWLHRVTAEHDLSASAAESSGLVIFVDDDDAHYESARAAGCKIDSAPQDMPYGQREYGARDLEGHRWWFASPLETST
jgi:uncharacterized glyoxalase superfamily protein PhnB